MLLKSPWLVYGLPYRKSCLSILVIFSVIHMIKITCWYLGLRRCDDCKVLLCPFLIRECFQRIFNSVPICLFIQLAILVFKMFSSELSNSVSFIRKKHMSGWVIRLYLSTLTVQTNVQSWFEHRNNNKTIELFEIDPFTW